MTHFCWKDLLKQPQTEKNKPPQFHFLCKALIKLPSFGLGSGVGGGGKGFYFSLHFIIFAIPPLVQSQVHIQTIQKVEGHTSTGLSLRDVTC